MAWRVSGAREAQMAIRELETKITSKILRQSMRDAMRPVQKDFKAAVPVGDTKDLKNSVKLRAGKRSRKGPSIVVGVFLETGQGAIAAATEYGTRYQRPQGYARKTFHRNRRSALADVTKRVKAGIEAAIKEVRKGS